MRKGMILGAIIGFLTGLSMQAYGSWNTGMVVLSNSGAHIIAVSFVVMLFVAASCGIIGAFVGALFEEGMSHFRH